MNDGTRKMTPNTRTASANHNATTKVPTGKLPIEIENALHKMRTDTDTASNWLRRYQLIPEDAQLSNTSLSTGLTHFATHASAKLGAWAIEAICAFAVYAEDVQADRIAQSVWKKLQPVIHDDLAKGRHELENLQDEHKKKHDEMMEEQERLGLEISGAAGRVSKVVRELADTKVQLAKELQEVRNIQQDLTKAVEKIATTSSKTEEALRNAEALPPSSQLGSGLNGKPSYASTVMRVLPPSHATSLARQDAQFRQILVDIRSDNPGEDAATALTPAEYIAKAEVALDLMRADNHPPPEGLRFLTVKRLRHGGLLYETSTKEGASWLQQPDNMRHFTDKFGHDAVIRAKYFPCLARNTPVCLDLDRAQTLRDIESWNGWTQGEVIAAHWIKPVAKRRAGQQRAHMILKLSTPQRANEAILNGVSIVGQRLPVEKLRKEARRCLRCQKLEPGHLARDCEMIEDICGTCAELHPTQSCTEHTRRCVNCASNNDHASWDRRCPAFIEATRKIQKANTLEQYRFYPLANDPDTWDHLDTPQLPPPMVEQAAPTRRERFNWVDDEPDPLDHNACDAPPHDRYQRDRRPRSHSRRRSPSRFRDDRAPLSGANRTLLDTQRDSHARSGGSRPRTWSMRSTSGQRQTMLTPNGGIRPFPSRPRTPSVSRTHTRT